MMIGYPMFRIEKLWYGTSQPARNMPPMQVLRIELSNGVVLNVPNTGWTADNPALCVLAYLGVSPSTMDEAEGKAIPVAVIRGSGGFTYKVPDMVLNNGNAHLKQAEWFNENAGVVEVDVETPNRNPGGSDNPKGL